MHDQADTNFKPPIPTAISPMKNILDKFIDSLKRTTPNTVVPMIPIPVQTA